ncbi:MAG: DUF2271 domain-containing protein [Propionibacteriaceae bacterium]|nr:DUF2271 domain-containing protein [Micropruina sp.]HBX82768.1 DUF2271 domain-containing protein [Propionibacteriaceae bacterium]HBY24785.1 DUF2271 domain-containing protein [Propionibacteriaceae bacterium]
MPDTTSRYSQVTRRAFLGGLSVAAIATVTACSSTSSTSSSSASSSSSTTGASAAATGPALPTTAKATVAWTFASSSAQKNPYMAVWIEDANGSFVKTVALYHKANGDNWLNTLTRWYSVSGGTNTTTSGTVPAGSFTASWDGSTASGARAVQGNYYVCVESVVEHGSESLVRQQVAFATTAAKTTLTAAGEITAASVDYTV